MLDDDLYTATKVEAARHSRKLREVVADAVAEWLEVQEDLELGKLADEAMAEYDENGGLEAGEFFRRLREEEAKRKSA
jgi:hypothetical protein